MKIILLNHSKLKRPPTGITLVGDRVYVPTKGKRVFYFPTDLSSSKSILFSAQVNGITTDGECILTCQKDGKIFGLSRAHKTILKIAEDIPCLCTKYFEDFFVAFEEKKICVYSQEGLLKNTAYFEGKLADFDVIDGSIGKCMQNDQAIYIQTRRGTNESGRANANSGNGVLIKIMDGYPETIRFLSRDTLLVGSSTGVLSCFSVVTRKRTSFLKLDSLVLSLHVLTEKTFLVGIENEILLVDCSNFNKMEVISRVCIKGFPVAFTGEETVFCAVSRESRIGRWQRSKGGENEIIKLQIEE